MKKLWILDWKSSKGIYPEYRIQGGCYFFMHNLLRDPKAEGVGILQLDKETGAPGTFEDCTAEAEKNWYAFLGLVQYYYIMLGDKEPKKFYPMNGSKHASITTVLDVLNKPALTQWAANSTVDYFASHLEELKGTPEQVEYILKKGKTAYRTVSKEALDTGSIVHDAIHAHLSGAKPEEILKDNDRAVNGFLAFLQWADDHKLEPLWLEEPIVDASHRIGGTPDFVGYAEI